MAPNGSVAARAAGDAVGREAELERLRPLLARHGPRVAYIHGIGGIGKSTLIQLFLEEAQERGTAVLRLDCRGVEPTPEGFLSALGAAAGGSGATTANPAAALGERSGPLVLALDTFEVFRLLDTWLRLRFLPRLDEEVRLVIAGRHPPSPGWLADAGAEPALTVALGALDAAPAAEILARAGLSPARCRTLAASLHGHPLALRLAASALAARSVPVLSDASLQGVMDTLTELHLAEVGDPDLRRAIEAMAVTRRATVPLLAGMFPEEDPEAMFGQLHALPFTEAARDGLRLHDTVRDAVERTLRARDPDRHREYRRQAWRMLVRQASHAARPDLWRYTADMLYLVENPVCREAFFPSGGTELTVEHARPESAAALIGIMDRHEGPGARSALREWLRALPDAFVVVRDAQGECAGFCCRLDPATAPPGALVGDPITAAWEQDLREDPVPPGQRVLFIRRWLDRTAGETPGAVQAAAWLDLKRTYMEMRPHLRRVYLTVTDLAPYAAVATELGFRVRPDRAVTLDGRTYHTAMLDFGPASVDGWLARLAAAELGLSPPGRWIDHEARELVLDDRRVPLTPLEYALIAYLCDHRGRAVSRRELLANVWGSDYTGWSNKVDAVVAGLRRKLGPRSGCIRTVTGAGYRYDEEEAL